MTEPAHLTALLRHCADLRDQVHGGARSRADKEAVFERTAELLAPVAGTALREANEVLLLGSGSIHDSGPTRNADGVSRTWTLTWPEQRERNIAPVTITAWFGGGFHHPHLRGATVRDWPLNVFDAAEAEAQLPVFRAIVAGDVHNLVFQADYRIIPAVLSDGSVGDS